MRQPQKRLSKTKRRCVRRILSRIRLAGGPAGGTGELQRKLRATVVDQLADKVGRETIVDMIAPKTEARASRSQYCPVCNRFTRHRKGECQEHEVKYCRVCQEMTAHTSNGKCSRSHLHSTPARSSTA